VKEILYILFGWILGIVNYYVLRRVERKRKIQDFTTGLLEELKEILPVIASVRFSIQSSLGEGNSETVAWVRNAIAAGKKDLLDPQMIEFFEKLVTFAGDDIKILSTLLKANPTKGKGFKKYHLPFLDTNINMVPLLDIGLQGAIFKIRRCFDMLEQEIDMYNFYFRKTFDPASMDVNSDILKENQRSCYKSISNICFQAGNHITSLIKTLETQK